MGNKQLMKNYRLLLENASLKTTPARLAVLSFLNENSDPLSAESIFDHVAGEHSPADRATIYRILETFFQKGIIKRLELGEGKYRYELTGEEHHHLICESCGKIEDISDCNISEFEKEIGRKKKFTVRRHSLEFFGLCSDCQN